MQAPADNRPLIRVTREIHDVPELIKERVTRAGGLNWLGQPNFRVVWGGARLAWIGGRWTDRDEHGNVIRERVELRRVPKYLPTERWYVERWMPPETYGPPELWSAQTVETENGIRIPALGPYPSRGDTSIASRCRQRQASSSRCRQLLAMPSCEPLNGRGIRLRR